MRIGSKIISVGDSRFASFRPVTSADEPLLLEIYGSTRAAELALTDWDQAQRDAFLRMQFMAQQSHYREHYAEGEHLVILVNERAVGRLYVAEIEKEVRILDITILPHHRSNGIGEALIRELMAEAALIGKLLSIYVESFNPSLSLFARLGFVKSDETGYSYLMEWRAESGGA